MIPVLEDPVMSPGSLTSSPSPLLLDPEEAIVKMEIIDDPKKNRPTILKLKSKTSKHSKACRFCSKILLDSQTCCFHEAENHPDKLLLEAKLDNTTGSKFLQICQDVLSKSNVIQSPHNKMLKRYGCLHCQNLYRQLNDLKHHSIQSHFPTLIKNVRQQQNINYHCTSRQNNINDNNKTDDTTGKRT